MWRTRRKPGQWATVCRDSGGRRRQILVVSTRDGRLALVFPPGEVAVLKPLQAGRLRAVLRDAVFALADPETRQSYTPAGAGWDGEAR